MSEAMVVLRDMQDEMGTRRLEASLNEAGDLVIEGVDRGKGVERVFGYTEYEWAWTIRAGDVPVVLRVLDREGDVLGALAERFSGEHAAGLHSFLEEKGVPVERWSRVGD